MWFLKSIFVSFITLGMFTSPGQSARIIFLFAGGNLSHKTSVWPFVLGLAEKGHQITFVSSHVKIPAQHENIRDLAPTFLVASSASAYDVDRVTSRANGEELAFSTYAETTLALCKGELESRYGDPEWSDVIQNGGEYYDLAIVNGVFGECGLLIASHWGVKYIVFDTTTILSWFHSTYGLPWQASWIPDLPMKLQTYPLGFVDRMWNFWSYYKSTTREQWLSAGMEALMLEHFNTSRRLEEIEQDVSLVLVNSHPAIDFARPLPPMFVHVGGMQCSDSSESHAQLPQNFQEFMDGAKDGVILIAFGSTIDLNKLPAYYLNIFFKMMRKFHNIKFIWRWSGPMPDGHPTNLLASEWLPQKEILRHPKIRAFMTHCGFGSVTEATCFGVPLLAVPLFADQDLNAYRIEAQGLGVKIEIQGINQNSMDDAVQEILSDPKYKRNMMTHSRILKDRPLDAVQTAIYWTEFVLRHDDFSCFKPMDLDQSPFVRHMFDVYSVLLCIFVFLPLSLMYLISRFLSKSKSK